MHNHPSPQALIDSYQRTGWIIDKQAEGLSHEDSLLQLPFRGNCMNWVLGHILNSRESALRSLDDAGLLDEAYQARYSSGSEPVDEESQDILPLESLLAKLKESEARIVASLSGMDADSLARAVPVGEDSQRLGEHIAFLHWHETYHTGQLEILRQLAGTNDRIIG
jgi:uncharacterized damage-inducible protein DinB